MIASFVITAVLGITFVICLILCIWSVKAYNIFSYNGKRQLLKHIVEGIAEHISVCEGVENTGFAIHDIMGPQRSGDMQAFVGELKKMGYQKVELIDATNGIFMSRKEATVPVCSEEYKNSIYLYLRLGLSGIML